MSAKFPRGGGGAIDPLASSLKGTPGLNELNTVTMQCPRNGCILFIITRGLFLWSPKKGVTMRLTCRHINHIRCRYMSIRKTCPCNIYPGKPHFYIAKLGYAGVYLFFLIFAPKHRLWVLVRTVSARRF